MMFRELRRKEKLLSNEEALVILERNSSGVLALCGDDGYPYAVPLNYAFVDGNLYFHCARVGHKIDAIGTNDKVSFAVVDEETNVPEAFTTIFKSAIAFGRARLLSSDPALKDVKQKALAALVRKFSPDYQEQGKTEIINDWDIVEVIEIRIEHLTAKGTLA
ncbi:MAG: pyridoxamine 5'-phosphate oxidase family protein [Clostridiales Family XIII bacterium]|nr:pyridoxamine 5'-phosphate oxidase family protein [Clostridiales Family XIII bacterium]